MKKLLMLAVLVATLGISAAAESPIKLSLFDNIAWPKTNNANVVLGLIDAKTPNVTGVSLSIGATRVDDMTGLAWSWLYTRTNELKGVQMGLYNANQRGAGVAYGLINHNTGAFTGVQLGFVNIANDMEGLQWGFVNTATELTGVQLGFVNYITHINKGLQIGLVNIIKNNGWLPVMVILNGRF